MRLKAILLFLFTLLALTSAFGQTPVESEGHYDVEFSGGEWGWSGFDGSYANYGPVSYTGTVAHRPPPNAWSDTGRLLAAKSNNSEASRAAYAHGPITATLRWNGGQNSDPPPPYVILKERIDVQVRGTSGQADCGIEGAESTPGRSQGFRERQLPGEQTIELTCSPSGVATDTSEGGFDSGRAAVDIQWQIDQIFLSVELKGTTKIGTATRAVVGQQVQAQLKVLNYGLPPNENYRWTVTGGEAFGSFRTIATATENKSVFVPFNVADFEGEATLNACFKAQEQVIVTWEGDPFGLGSMTIEKIFNVIEPSRKQYIRMGGMHLVHRTTAAEADPLADPPVLEGQLVAATPSLVANAWKMFGAEVAVQDSMDRTSSILHRGGVIDRARVWRLLAQGETELGAYAHLQLVRDNSRYNGVIANTTIAGQYVLDNQYPYAPPFQTEGVSEETPAKLFIDSPGIDDLGDTGMFPFGQSHRLDQDQTFQLYLMYRPPYNGLSGSDVPLTRVVWSVGGWVQSLASRSESSPYAWNPSSVAAPQAVTLSATPRPAHPIWLLHKPAQ